MEDALHAGSPRGFLDEPRTGTVIGRGGRGVFRVLGWAFDQRGSVAVDIEIDGELADRGRLGLPRPDVAATLDEPISIFSGWECLLDLHAIAAGRRSLRIEALARGRNGERVCIGTATVGIDGAGPLPRNVRWEDDPRPAPPLRPDGRLRILAVIHNLDRGGSQLILFERLRELTEDGTAEAVVVSPSDGALRGLFESIGIPCHVTGPLIAADPLLYEEKIAELATWCRPRSFDVVLASTIWSSPGIDLARRLGLPSLWLVYERTAAPGHLSPFVTLHWPAYAIDLTNEALRRCPLIVFDSDACRRDYIGKAAPERLLTIPGAIDIAEIDRSRAAFDRAAARRACGLPEDAQLVLGLGSILALKGTPQLVQAFAVLAAELPDLRLALVGSRPDQLSKSIEEFVAARGLRDRVFIVPMGTDAYRWLGMADLLVCASERESMPRTVLEGMAFEVPVLSTTVGDVPSVIADGVSGWLIPPGDPMALEAAIRRAVAASAEERGAMTAAASRFVREHRDARLARSRFAAALREVCSSPSEGGVSVALHPGP